MLTYFIADLHLAQNRPDITACFLSFLADEAPKSEKLYILGDLFELWIGDDNHTVFHQTIAHAIASLTNQGTEVFFIHGNRDFLVGKKFAKQAGMTLLPEKTIIDLYGEKALIMHGDTLCTQDVSYQKFRKMSRSWWWKMAMLAMPLSYRRNKAKQIQTISAEQKSNKSLEIMDVTPEEVVNDLERYQCQLLIHGHTHRPNVHQHKANGAPATRFVLGDWYEQGAWLKVTPTSKELLNQPFE